MSVNSLTVHSLLCICRVCTTKKVLILRVSTFCLSLILTFTYPVISHSKKYTYCWFTTFKLHILLAAHPNPTPNDVSGGLCFAQVVGDTRINNYLPPCLLCIFHSYLSVLVVLISHSVFDLGCNPGTWLSPTLPFLIPSFHLTSDNVVQPYRDSSFSYQTTIWKTRAIITHFWCCSVIPVVRGAIHIPSHSSYNISGQHKTNTTPLRHFCIMLPKGSSWCTISGGLIAAFSSRSCIKYQNHKGLLPFKSSSPWKDPLCWLFHSRRNE